LQDFSLYPAFLASTAAAEISGGFTLYISPVIHGAPFGKYPALAESALPESTAPIIRVDSTTIDYLFSILWGVTGDADVIFTNRVEFSGNGFQ
jgi:hypothetical protein